MKRQDPLYRQCDLPKPYYKLPIKKRGQNDNRWQLNIFAIQE